MIIQGNSTLAIQITDLPQQEIFFLWEIFAWFLALVDSNIPPNAKPKPVGNKSQIQVSTFGIVTDTIFPDYRLVIGVQEILRR